MPRRTINNLRVKERAFLLGIKLRNKSKWVAKDSLLELGDLARSAGASVVGQELQNLNSPTNTYVGKGKLKVLENIIVQKNVNTLICDDELSPTQQQNLELALSKTGVKVIDRTALILDVFARRAITKEGRIQVRLAQEEYLLPRLAGQWSHLERLGGGIGTRGPGETQIETDRRLVRNSIQRLRKNIEDVRKRRQQYRQRRQQENGIPVVSLVGYTNAGKSTVLNQLTNAEVLAENRMFSTLDPVTRKIFLPSGNNALLTDTVGFIQKLPTSIVAAFRATLEEVVEADIIVHVLDISHPNMLEQARVVEALLDDLDVSGRPRLVVLNKVDLISEKNSEAIESKIDILSSNLGNIETVKISALKSDGFSTMLAKIDDILAINDRGL